MVWPLLEKFREQGIFSSLDLYFTRRASHHLGGLDEEEAFLFAAAMAAARRGHLCLDRQGASLLADETLQKHLEQGFAKFRPNPFLYREGDRVYLSKNWELEQTLLRHLQRLALEVQSTINPFPLAGMLNAEQREAVQTALQHTLSFVTGGPGTGKTFTAAAIAQAFLANHSSAKIILAAPTARAADHLKKRLFACQVPSDAVHEAGTLHKILGMKNVKQPSKVPFINAQLVIVDECSMIDADLFVALLAGVSERSTVVLMGDPDQLHPVGIGSLFSDLVRSKTHLTIGRAHLKSCLRVEDRPLLDLAAALQNGRPCAWPLLDWAFEERDIFYDKVWEMAKTFWPLPSSQEPDPKMLFEKLGRFRFLSVLRQGPFGTEAINHMLASRLFAKRKSGDTLAIPIQILRNDSATNLCNGEIGILIESRSRRYALFAGLSHPIPAAILPAYEYAFCTSVHKSQGSEYEEVFLIAPHGSETFGREMLYTAVTRAKKRLHVVSTPAILAAMQTQVGCKFSGLK